MDERNAWLNTLLGATERALGRAHLTDPYLYLELLEIHAQLQRKAVQMDADAELSRERSTTTDPTARESRFSASDRRR